MEYLAGTPGENIPQLNMRVSCKHRGIQKRYEGMTGDDLRAAGHADEGIATLAHVLAFCQAAERIAGCQPTRTAGLVRVPHTELERVGNPLDVTVTLAATAGLAAATAPCPAGIPGLSSRVGSRYGLGGSLAAVEHLPQALARTVA